jgi:predicted methyltransferase
MGFESVLTTARRLVRDCVQPGETVVDATVGNGTDTLFLAETTGTGGVVFGFDIQEVALVKTRQRLQDSASRGPRAEVSLLLVSHALMAEHIPAAMHGQVAAIMFNLGYLPGADHTVVTRPGSTIAALDASLTLLRPGGVLTLVLYTGHPGGPEEAEAVALWAEALHQERYQALRYQFVNQANRPPYLLAVTKR